MGEKDLPALPELDRELLHYNPNTDDIVDHVHGAMLGYGAECFKLGYRRGVLRDTVEVLRERGSDLTCHPVANGTIADTEHAGELLIKAGDEIAALRAEVEALRADAERWRTYRTAGCDLTLRLHNTRSDHRDAAIDAARAEKGPADA